MQSFKRLCVVCLALGLAAVVLFFTLENRTPVHLLFFGWQTPELPMALYVMSAFVLGLILGPLLSWWPHQRMRMRYNKQVKQLRTCEQKIQALESASLDRAAASSTEVTKPSQ